MPLTILGRAGKGEYANALVVVESVGKVDISGLLKASRVFDFLTQRFRFMERMQEELAAVEAETGVMSGVVYVLDLEGLEMSTDLMSAVTGPYRILWSRIGDNYVEWIRKFFIINAPTFLSTLFSALSPFMPEGTLEKLIVCDENWRETLAEHIVAETLPEEWGGTGAEVRIATSIGRVPESMYWHPACPEEDPNHPSWLSVSIEAGDFFSTGTFVLDKDVILRLSIWCPQDYNLGVSFTADPKEKSHAIPPILFFPARFSILYRNLAEMEDYFPIVELPGIGSSDTLALPLKVACIFRSTA